MNRVEEFEFTAYEEKSDNNIYALIIYDIVDDKRRNNLVKFLQGYGFRVQKSCFEVMIGKTLFNKLKVEINKYVAEGDSVRIYKINGHAQVTCYGNNTFIAPKDIIII